MVAVHRDTLKLTTQKKKKKVGWEFFGRGPRPSCSLRAEGEWASQGGWKQELLSLPLLLLSVDAFLPLPTYLSFLCCSLCFTFTFLGGQGIESKSSDGSTPTTRANLRICGLGRYSWNRFQSTVKSGISVCPFLPKRVPACSGSYGRTLPC